MKFKIFFYENNQHRKLYKAEMSIAVENLPLPRRDSISKKSYRDAAAPRRYK